MGNGTATLHKRSGRDILILEAALNDGNHYYVELTRVEE